MKKSALLAGLCVVFGMTTLSSADDFIAQVVSVSGKVLHRNETNKAVKMGFLKPGEKLFEGSVVNTGGDGSIKLLMTDRTIVDLGPTSIFKVNEYKLNNVADRTVDVALDSGKMRTSVNKKLTDDKGKFTVRTKAATMGVRGTEFIVSAPLVTSNSPNAKPDLGSIVVTSGVVATGGAGGSSTVRAGQSLAFSSTPGANEPPKTLSTQQVSTIRTEASVPDRTFTQNVTFDSKSAPSNQASSSSSGKSGESSGGSSEGKSGESAKSDSGGDGSSSTAASGDGSGKGDSGSTAKSDGAASGDGSGSGGGDGKAGGPPPPPPAEGPGNQMMTRVTASVGAAVKVELGSAPPPPPPPPVNNIRIQPPSVPIDQRTGTNVNIRVKFNR